MRFFPRFRDLPEDLDRTMGFLTRFQGLDVLGLSRQGVDSYVVAARAVRNGKVILGYKLRLSDLSDV